MLNKLFDLDNPVMKFLSDLFDLMVLNLITLLLCIPVVTAVPALIALHYMALRMARREQTYMIKPYFKSFRENFKQGFLIGLIFIAAAMVLAVDVQIISHTDAMPTMFKIGIAAVAIIVILLFSWVIPLQSRFENTIGGTFRNSVLLSLGNFPRTLLMALIWMIPVAVFVISVAIWPLDLLFGLSVPAFLCAKVYSPVFLRFEPEEEAETPDEEFSMDERDLAQFADDLHDTFDRTDSI